MEKDNKPDFQAQKRSDDFKMQPDEFQELRDQIDQIPDNQLNRVLHTMTNHLGHLHGYDYAREDAKKRAIARKEARMQEDADAKNAADALALQRAQEDKSYRMQPLLYQPLIDARPEEDKRLDEQAKARADRRAQEDKEEG